MALNEYMHAFPRHLLILCVSCPAVLRMGRRKKSPRPHKNLPRRQLPLHPLQRRRELAVQAWNSGENWKYSG